VAENAKGSGSGAVIPADARIEDVPEESLVILRGGVPLSIEL
jgi:hypothetical protein